MGGAADWAGVGFGGTVPHGAGAAPGIVEIVHRCPQVRELDPRNDTAAGWRKLLLSGRGLAAGLGPLVVAADANNVLRFKTARVPGRVRVSEFGFWSTAAAATIIVRPIYSDENDATTVLLTDQGSDRSAGQFVPAVAGGLPGFFPAVAGQVYQIPILFVLPALAQYLGVHVWNNSGNSVSIGVYFGLEELVFY